MKYGVPSGVTLLREPLQRKGGSPVRNTTLKRERERERGTEEKKASLRDGGQCCHLSQRERITVYCWELMADPHGSVRLNKRKTLHVSTVGISVESALQLRHYPGCGQSTVEETLRQCLSKSVDMRPLFLQGIQFRGDMRIFCRNEQIHGQLTYSYS
ncbi:hypothetical protein JZ751_000003 [Albula glossodonta]|uniref:Uncharacterized protein n=1 Tax=Albula glossodonta TaxID=121402 RepID=A0A8T2PV14_9TELE|nr:hypothetical protein JZ751_000003 [Albula glossodonta]